MEKREKLEIDIDIKDLFWEFLRGWRVIVCCALIGGILLGSMSFVSSYKRVNAPVVPNEPVTVPPTAQEIIDNLTIDELPDVVAAVELKAQIDDKTAYIKNSVLMQIDPFMVECIALEYYISGEDVATVKSSLKNLVANGVFNEDLYTNELVSIVSEDGNTVVVEVMHLDAESCALLAENVKSVIEKQIKTLKGAGVVSEAKLISENHNVVVDEELHVLQDTYLKACMDDQDTLAKMRADMNGNQVSAYFHMWNMMYGEVEETEQTEEPVNTTINPTVDAQVPQKARASVDFKQVVLGMAAGTVLAVVYLFAAYLMTGKLRTAGEVEKLYGVKLLGTLKEADKKKNVFAGVDKVIYGLRHLGAKKLSIEEEAKLSAASVAIQCQKKNTTVVYVSSSKLNVISTKILETLRTELESKGITVQLGADILSDADALLHAAKTGNILFIEKESESAYKGILKCMQVCNNNHIDVLGVVVVEK